MKAATLEFANLYPTAAKNEQVLFGTNKEKFKKNLIKTPRKDDSESPRQKKDKRISSRNASENDADTSGVGPKIKASTPKSKTNTTAPEIESILKNAETPFSDKPKKRNKSVSFVLDDGEVPVATKKSKKSSDVGPFIKIHPPSEASHKPRFKNKKMERNVDIEPTVEAMEVISVVKNKKKKKKKLEAERVAEGVEVTEEPKKKKKKKQNPAENIAKNLENLSIGENANTLAGLLDEIQVADKPNKRKNKKKKIKVTDANGTPSDESTNNESKTDVASNENDRNTQNTKKIHKKKKNKSKPEEINTEGQTEVAEKVKWKKRWNKNKKGEIYGDDLSTTVVVENLPLSMMLTYRKALNEHFAKCGVIKKIGIVELYPTEEPRPVFTTTLQFDSEGAATQALEEDNMVLRGGRMRVRKLLPPTETTVVVRCYRGCSQEHMSSIFAPCGKIRSIRAIQKGRSSRPTAFVEFDGPDAVERALKVAEEAKIGGKKVLVQKFQNRDSNKRKRTASEGGSDKESDQNIESDQDDDSS